MADEKRLIGIETNEFDKTLKPRFMRLIFSDGTQEICHADDPKMKGRMFKVGDMKKDVQ